MKPRKHIHVKYCCEIKIIFHPLGSLAGFPARVIVL
jgi:hypothetical protein